MKQRKTEVKIIQVMFAGDTPRFVELYSPIEGRNLILKAQRACDVFGLSIDELEAFN